MNITAQDTMALRESNELYTRVKKAKDSVEFMLKRYPEEFFEIGNRDQLFSRIISDFTPDERRVIACGQFIENGNKKNKMSFAMPSTTKVLSIFRKNHPSFELGFFKAIIVHKVTESEDSLGKNRELVTTCVTYTPTSTEE